MLDLKRAEQLSPLQHAMLQLLYSPQRSRPAAAVGSPEMSRLDRILELVTGHEHASRDQVRAWRGVWVGAARIALTD